MLSNWPCDKSIKRISFDKAILHDIPSYGFILWFHEYGCVISWIRDSSLEFHSASELSGLQIYSVYKTWAFYLYIL